MRADGEIVTHSSGVDFGAWTRAEADRIQEEFEHRSIGPGFGPPVDAGGPNPAAAG